MKSDTANAGYPPQIAVQAAVKARKIVARKNLVQPTRADHFGIGTMSGLDGMVEDSDAADIYSKVDSCSLQKPVFGCWGAYVMPRTQLKRRTSMVRCVAILWYLDKAGEMNVNVEVLCALFAGSF